MGIVEEPDRDVHVGSLLLVLAPLLIALAAGDRLGQEHAEVDLDASSGAQSVDEDCLTLRGAGVIADASGEVADQVESLAGLEERCADTVKVEPAGGLKARVEESEVEVVPVDVGDDPLS